MSEIGEQISAFIASAKDYFADLSNEEKYGWIGEGVGFALFLTGIILMVF